MYGTDYSYLTTPSSTAASNYIGVFAGAFSGFFIIIGILSILILIAQWQMFKKAGRKPWEALIPVHSFIIEMELANIETYWCFLTIAAIIPVIGWIAPVILYFWKNIELSKAFGKGTGFGVLLTLLPFIGYPMLGFGNAEYQGNIKAE